MLAAVVLALTLTAPIDLARGSPDRAALMALLRPIVEKDVGPPVEFVARAALVEGDRACLLLVPQRKGGRPIDWDAANARRPEGKKLSGWVFALAELEGEAFALREVSLIDELVPKAWRQKYPQLAPLFDAVEVQTNAEVP